eukprot:CAMPEP_0198682918 /NCGR_PEP_ID=MMETSP1468-20131203/9678_1 /TAXON_ID=1461545 /ORGANISM="Mantoniella sp, Strain CCMP1436" /LENGTH=44 /DNA_ID= /DNA_START= /DNA_END= /DNA_ORIENTATION=
MSDEESKARRDTICLFEVKLDAHSPTAALEMRAHHVEKIAKGQV